MGICMVDEARVAPGTDGSGTPVIYIVDAPEHPIDLEALSQGRVCALVALAVRDWNNSLTPWPAAGLYRGNPDFGGNAATTLDELTGYAIPAIEKAYGLAPRARAICGYSLGGLFSLYALTHSSAFAACACLSGSVWYEGWVDHLRSVDLDLRGRLAYLSLGTKEKRAARPILKRVQDCMDACAQILKECGCMVEYRLGPGNHMQHVDERFAAGLAALDAFLQ